MKDILPIRLLKLKFFRDSAFLLALCCISFNAKAQLFADFTSDTTKGCSPLFVQFQDLSGGGTIIYRHWTFTPTQVSVGNNTAPTASFVNPGLYTITLRVSNGVDTATVTKAAYIHVFTPPTPNFSSTTSSVCAPSLVQFTNSSTAGSAPIQTYTWSMGDGSQPTHTQHTSHTYSAAGSYHVTLQISDTNKCSASITKSNHVEVFKPKVNFGAVGVTHSCSPPLQVIFTNSSSGSLPFTYQWSFGDGGTSNQRTPTYVYTTTGTFDVRLIVTDVKGCSDTLIKPSFASATQTKAIIDLEKDTFCRGELISFKNLSVGGVNFSWDFGDGSTTVNGYETQYAYQQTGVYFVKLKAWLGTQCQDSVLAKVVITEANANFSTTPTYSCDLPESVQFTDLSTPQIAFWYWRFGAPVQVESMQQHPNISFSAYGTFNDTLIVQSVHGCKDTIIKVANRHFFKLNQQINHFPQSGCAPLTVSFGDFTTPVDSIASRTWYFHDGTTSTQINTSFTYTQAGVYTIYLKNITPTGCEFIDSVTVEVGNKQLADFSLDTNIGCASDSAVFINLSTDKDSINFYQWAFSDGQGSSEMNPKMYFQDTGFISATLVVGFNGCFDTITKANVFRVLGPIIEFTDSMHCSDVYKRHLFSKSIDADFFIWDLGSLYPHDTNNSAIQVNFPYRGNFTVKIKAFNVTNGCEHEFEKRIEIRDPKAIITTNDSIICNPSHANFLMNNSIDAQGLYKWNSSNGDSATNFVNYRTYFPDTGFYTVRLIVSDKYGCLDTTSIQIESVRPYPDFIADSLWGCIPFNVQFTDSTFSKYPITQWNWSFGNGTSSTQQHPLATFDKLMGGVYQIQLLVKDTFGCTEFIQKPQYIKGYQPLFRPISLLNVCVFDTVSFQNLYHHSSYTYLWTFHNSHTSHFHNPTTHYIQAGKYPLSVIVTDTMGCDSVFNDTAYIDVHALPGPAITATPRDSSCYPVTVNFTDTSQSANISYWIWDFGTGEPEFTLQSASASYTYTFPGSFDITLKMISIYGCEASTTFPSFINISGPWASFSVDDTLCFGENIRFQIDSSFGVHQFRLDFADGTDTTFSGNASFMNHTYTTQGTLGPRLFMYDSLLHCPKHIDDTIYIHKITAEAVLDTLMGCTPLQINGTGSANGATHLQWLAKQQTFSGNSFAELFTNSGFHTIHFVAIDSLSKCTDSLSWDIEVFALPNPKISGPSVLCLGDSVNLSAQDFVINQWSPDDKILENKHTTILISPTENTQYTLKVTDYNGCVNTAFHTLIVQHPLQISFPSDTTLYEGQEYYTEVSANGLFTIEWENLKDIGCDNCPEFWHRYYKTTHLKARITDPNNCFPIDTSFTVFVKDEFHIFIPNAFTPNNDGLNDEFQIHYLGIKELLFFRVFDRMGQLLFSTDNINEMWNGLNHKLEHYAQNLLVYELKAVRFNDKQVEMMGTITIIR